MMNVGRVLLKDKKTCVLGRAPKPGWFLLLCHFHRPFRRRRFWLFPVLPRQEQEYDQETTGFSSVLPRPEYDQETTFHN